MKVLIDVPNWLYNAMLEHREPIYSQSLGEAVRDGIPLNSLEKPNKWIPVSERLPEKNMACLVAVGKFNLTQMAMYSDLMGTIDHRIFYQGDYGYDSFEDITEYVKAWMPLPEPYKASPTEAESEGGTQHDG